MHITPGHSPRPARRGFTLIELLVVIGIIALLAALALPVYSKVQKSGQMSRELNAGRQAMVAYAAFAADNDGELLKGYDKNVGSVTLPGGKTVDGEMCCRYPWRLAAYLGDNVDEVFLINDAKRSTETLKPGSFEYQYRASLTPAFGINAYCVGGYSDGTTSTAFSSDVVKRMGSASRASRLITFASARMKQGAEAEVPGYFIVTPPKFFRSQWSKPFKSTDPAGAFGNVDLRWSGKAICTFLDGHVEMLGEPEIHDMRYWSNTAAETDNKDFVVPR